MVFVLATNQAYIVWLEKELSQIGQRDERSKEVLLQVGKRKPFILLDDLQGTNHGNFQQ